MIVGIVACFLNAIALFVVIPHFSSRMGLYYNQDVYADGYNEIAATIASGGGYRFFPDTAQTVMREPGYPLFLAGIFFVFGENLTAVKLANMILALASAWLVVKIARKVSNNEVLILASPVLFLLHPGVLIAESRGGVEILFTFCLSLFVFALYRAIESNRFGDYMASGGALGLTVLVKSTLMLFPIFLLGYLLIFVREGVRATCKNVGLMVVTMFIVLSPWIVRNYTVTGKFIPTASVLGISAHSGQYVCENLSSDNLRKDVDTQGARERRRIALELGYPFKDIEGAYYQYFYSTGDEIKFSNFLLGKVVSEYESSPKLLVRCTRSNLFDFWFAGKTWQSTKMNMVVQIPYLLLAVVGVGLSWREHQLRVIAPLILLIIYTVAVYAPILAQARYSVPIIPFLSILASLALAAARRRFSDSGAMENR
jgi:4-amino-4-deoxy-L-arabinose transferase-like glycosyltransferase